MAPYRPENPLIVQADHTVLVEVASPHYEDARNGLLPFTELVKSPEHVHTYRITPLSIWNARASGLDADTAIETLERFAKYPVPDNVVREVRDHAARWGRLTLQSDGDGLLLIADEPALARALARHRVVAPFLRDAVSPVAFRVNKAQRGWLKQALVQVGFPVDDVAGYATGEPLTVELRETCGDGSPFALRDYQEAAAEAFWAAGTARGGSGVVVLPCGAGKTIVGLGCMSRVGMSTLIITTSVTAARQWRDELLDKTTLEPDQIGEYTGHSKDLRPVTVATYQVLTHRPDKNGPFPHLGVFEGRSWGLVIYDEVHLLPAPVFRITAELQARRRLGLTATLVREDGRETDVFALIGPKKAEVPWKNLEQQGWIAEAHCIEVRIPLGNEGRLGYILAERRAQVRLAAENRHKLDAVRAILDRHPDTPALVMGTYVTQVREMARALEAPVIAGDTSQSRRDTLFDAFRQGRIPVLAVTKVANFAIDLPDAGLAIQISGTFGSRQEEAQRLGRLLRPKRDGNRAYFYSLVSRETVEQDFSAKRQRFLCEQGYAYDVLDFDDLFAPEPLSESWS